MKNVEAYRRLAKKVADYNLRELSGELKEAQRKQNTLEEEALKAEILEDKNWEAKRDEARQNREKVDAIKKKIDVSKEAAGILQEQQQKISRAAKKEVEAEYRPAFEAKARELLKKARETEKVELELEQIIGEANSLCKELDSHSPHAIALESIIFHSLRLIAHGGYGQRGELCDSPLMKFIEDCKEAGIKID
ncbi:MAG TPA: hypothetical protein ENI18_08765 [Candidatus Aminicenantes bacterium]|nr:hypothetical protein [Candidatus Aminicenantes bacterium]